MKKNIPLFITLILIIGGIWYLESHKARPALTGTAVVATSSVAAATSSVKENLRAIAAEDQKNGYGLAYEFVSPSGFINTQPFKLSDLIGKKVILLDFWTYSCINCVRTLPYLEAWDKKYRDQGLEIIGVHTPEFNFEKNYDNVKAAVAKYGIQYPVVLDSNYAIWSAYKNLYWPHEYLIDIAGYIVHDHIGEGDYEATEGEIQKLLAERNQALGLGGGLIATTSVAIKPADLSGIGSPETYFGAARNQFLANGTIGATGTQDLTEPTSPKLNQFYLTGQWNFLPEYAVNLQPGAKIIYKYHSAKVFFVASAPKGTTLEIFQDSKPVGLAAGSDVINGQVFIQQSRLYNLISNPDGSGEHTLEIIIDSPGLEAYTFTFG